MAQELASIEEQLKVAIESSGDMEVLDALIAKSKFFARIGNKAEAYKALDEVSRRTQSGAYDFQPAQY